MKLFQTRRIAVVHLRICCVLLALCSFLLLLRCGGGPYQDARGPSAQGKSLNNLKQLAFALQAYHASHGHFPPPAIRDGQSDRPLLSWRVAILPYLEHEHLYKQFKLDEPWDSPHNKKLLDKMPNLFAPPGMTTREPHVTCYQGFVGKGTMFEPGAKIHLGNVDDGASHTLLLVEASKPVPWTKPQDIDYERTKPLPKLGTSRYYVLALLANGEVRFLKPNPSPEMLHRAIVRDDGLIPHFDELEK